ncbi:hypothetical protein GCM10023330_13240 [Litoribaculum gwangyangense]|uniref:Transposase n=1 Tax=Litoribaculum gwangyangense TaxID=1130722 RepID=A0ABP9CCV9_9FLAO
MVKNAKKPKYWSNSNICSIFFKYNANIRQRDVLNNMKFKIINRVFNQIKKYQNRLKKLVKLTDIIIKRTLKRLTL